MVFSLNRTWSGPAASIRTCLRSVAAGAAIISSEPFEHGQAVRYPAPAKGIFHATCLNSLGDWLASEIGKLPRPDLLVAHKLTIEGIAVQRAARILGLPFAVSIQGNTDEKILAARPDLRRRFARIFHEAAIVFPFTPWAMSAVEAKLGRRRGAVQLLPAPTDLDSALEPAKGNGTIVSAFHLRNHKIKNLSGLAAAAKVLREQGEDVAIAIAGGGAESELVECQHIVRGTRISLAGSKSREEMPKFLNQASGFVLPSLRESFGVVFTEALFAGLPVIYPAGAAIDGYFDDCPFAIRVDARDTAAIAAAIRRLLQEEETLKAEIAVWQKSDAAKRFQRHRIAQDFASGLLRGLYESRTVAS
ncbi:glycosyltransferase [Aurantiacibacter sp. D1-12]|uniref:glycosyltransferase n=1 Tax=Aurantiacibacter sp. D1-12 TaxID=2993658 RepID=UPI00237CD1C6|nr:glycosyltransferase [Aurantiacibacter sp. D1-12]MDE1467463.1 glycosyltransferase [Aurantiacibacter sp. D1-12]